MADDEKDPDKLGLGLAEPNKTLIDLEGEDNEEFYEENNLEITSPLSYCFDHLSQEEAQRIIDESKSPKVELENPALLPTLLKLRKSRAVDYSYITRLSKNVKRVVNEGY